MGELLRGPYGRIGVVAAVGLVTLLIVSLLFAANPGPRLEKRISALHVGQADGGRGEPRQRPRGLEGASRSRPTGSSRTCPTGSGWRRPSSRPTCALRPAELFYVQLGAAVLGGLVATVLDRPRRASPWWSRWSAARAPFLYVRRTAGEAPQDVRVAAPRRARLDRRVAAGRPLVRPGGLDDRQGRGRPGGQEFGRVENETRLGRSTDIALQGMADRLASKNFEFVVIAVNIQRQVGGSLAEILDMVADTVRGREQFTRKVKALTAMGRASAWVLLGDAVLPGPDAVRDAAGVHPAAVLDEHRPHDDRRRHVLRWRSER